MAKDYSLNQIDITGLNLLQTATVSNAGGNNGFVFQNQSAAVLYVALDDGAGGSLTVMAYDPGAGANRQGGGDDNHGNYGASRLRVYGTAGSAFALRLV